MGSNPQHWFGAGPSFSFCATCMRRTVLGYYQVVPAGLCAANSYRNSGAGKKCTSFEPRASDPALMSNRYAEQDQIERVQIERVKALTYAPRSPSLAHCPRPGHGAGCRRTKLIRTLSRL